MTTNVLHALVPAAFTFKGPATEPASAALGRLSLLHPTSVADIFEAILEGSPIFGISIVGGNGAEPGARFRLVHASMMLGEEILSIEVIVNSLVARDVWVQVRIA